jgi:hypothetical protein
MTMTYNIEENDKNDNVYYKMNSKYFDILLEVINSTSRMTAVKKKLLKSHIGVLNWIDESLPLLKSNIYEFKTKVFWIVHGLTDFPKCANPACKRKLNNRNVESFIKGYPVHCSHKCAVNDPVVKEHAKQTCLDKYGAISPAKNEDVKAKSRNTCLKKYGVEYSFQSENNKEKTRKTCLEKYSVEHISTAKEIIEQIECTKRERYGDSQPWHSTESMNKRKNTWLDNYGVDHPMKSTAIKAKVKKTLVDNYGVDHFSKTDEFKYERAKMSYENIILKNEYDSPMFSLEEYTLNRRTGKNKLKFRCKKCGNTFESVHCDGHHSKCPKCFPVERSFSNEEKDVVKFLKSVCNCSITENTKTIIPPFELDIYIPDKKFAIEFDGLYWHDDDKITDYNYHVNKTMMCNSSGIQLVHIFENEWLLKTGIVKSRLKNLLGIYDNAIFARKCIVKEIDSKTSYIFQNENHIQGAVNAKVNIGLFFNDELISLMTFGKTRFSKKYEWELVRFCNKLNYHIPGAAGKLLKFFERRYKPNSLVSYADRRWSIGKLYTALGFKLDHISKPDYWYFKQNKEFILESRIKFQKHKLHKILNIFDPTKTEVENMKANGYHRIFDCGNLVFVKNYDI